MSVPRGLCKRHRSVSDPRAVPEKRSPEGRSASEEREDAAKGRDISEGWRARRCESRRVSVMMGLCKRLGSVSDPRAVPEERSPEGSSASEGRECPAEGSSKVSSASEEREDTA